MRYRVLQVDPIYEGIVTYVVSFQRNLNQNLFGNLIDECMSVLACVRVLGIYYHSMLSPPLVHSRSRFNLSSTPYTLTELILPLDKACGTSSSYYLLIIFMKVTLHVPKYCTSVDTGVHTSSEDKDIPKCFGWLNHNPMKMPS